MTADELIAKHVEKQDLGGAVLLVQKDGEVVHKRSFGLADLGAEMTEEHVFDIASLTKVYGTTLACMLLVDRGNLVLDEPVSTYLKEFGSEEKKAITLRQLLNHSSSLLEWKPLYYHVQSKAEALKFIADLPLKYPVGEGRHYSDLGFMILGLLIERVSQQSLDQFLGGLYSQWGLQCGFAPPSGSSVVATSQQGNDFEERMVKDDTFGFHCEENFENFNHWRQGLIRGEVNDGNAHYVFDGVAGHAGLFARIDDLYQLGNLLLKNDGSVVSQKTFAEFTRTDKYGNGLGWAKSDDVLCFKNTSNAFGHYGFTGTTSVLFPESQSALHLLTNRQFYGLRGNGYFDWKELTGKLVEEFDLQ